jgi:hypothetical protein
MKLRCAAVSAWLCSLICVPSGTAQTRRALLIGINTYEPAGTSATHPQGCTYGRCELGYFENPDGPPIASSTLLRHNGAGCTFSTSTAS